MENWSARLDVAQLASGRKTPFYILNLAAVTEAVNRWSAITGSPSRIAYPIKANPALPLLKHLQKLGTRAECASEHEVTLALLAGFQVNRIVYNSPAADADLAWHLLEGGATVVADNVRMLQAIGEMGERRPGTLLARVAPSASPSYASAESWHELTAHADPQTKFGIPAETLVADVAKSGVRLDGLHLHAGTMMDDAAVFAALRDELAGLAMLLQAAGHPTRILNLGGGLAIDFRGTESLPGIDDVGAALRAACGLEDAELWVEPGHALVGSAVNLMTRVVETKDMRGRRWAICDVGSDQLVKVTLLDWRHRVLKQDGTPLAMEGPDALGGPLCFAGDVLLPQTSLEGVERGDLLMVQHTGAYCAAMENRFNGRLSPELVVIDERNDVATGQRRGTSLFTPEIMLHEWIPEPSADGKADSLGLDHVWNLRSAYLRDSFDQDVYEFAEVTKLDEHHYRFVIQANSAVPFVSLPYAVRLIGDVAIIAVLDRAGVVLKEAPVWGRRLSLTAVRNIGTDKPVVCDMTLSPEMPCFGKNSKRALTAFNFNQGEMTGQMEVVW